MLTEASIAAVEAALQVTQGSDEWHLVRLGKVSASRIADVMARDRSGKNWGVTRRKYMGVLAAERLSGIPRPEGFMSAAMENGTLREGDARTHYEIVNLVEVRQVGFVIHPAIPMAGASPDGLVGDDGIIQIKCPETHTHIDTILYKQAVPVEYIKQIQWEMACTRRKWCDFVSFDPFLPAPINFFEKRIYRDDELIGELERNVELFLHELAEQVAALGALCNGLVINRE